MNHCKIYQMSDGNQVLMRIDYKEKQSILFQEKPKKDLILTTWNDGIQTDVCVSGSSDQSVFEQLQNTSIEEVKKVYNDIKQLRK